MSRGQRRLARWRSRSSLALFPALIALTADVAAGQQLATRATEEIRLLREAEAREAAGDLAGAEAVLRGLLEANPGALSALITYERLLHIQGRLADVLPAIERLLEQDPASVIGHHMRVRTYSALNQVEDMERAAEAWIESSPRTETPYREIGRAWFDRGEYGKALEVLQRGRDRLRRADALALELGDVYAALKDYSRAAAEWERAIGRDGNGFLLVQRRLASLPDGGAQIIPLMIEGLTRKPVTVGRRKAATILAIDAGLGERAEQIARQVARDLKGTERQSFLVEVARRADGARLHRLAYWAYSELLKADGPNDRKLAIRSRLAELALAIGDTAQAAENFRVLEQAAAVGSPDRRQAAALRIELMARGGDADGAAREIERFRQEFPEAPELDRAAATVASVYLDRGSLAAAERILQGVAGPQSDLVRGRIALRQGDVARARAAFLSAAPRLEGAQATETIGLVALLGRLSPAGGRLVGQAVADVAAGKTAEALARLTNESRTLLSDQERAAVLDFAASLAARNGLIADAERIRRSLVEEYPRSPEAPGALLALARSLMERGGSDDEVRRLLERLILEYPRSALVPQARRELERLRGAVSETPQNVQ